ncbi:hypothetical protein [Paraburkholderia sp. J63]|uniref:hypothetical protein n=1 Tax=Paraburkholderia sp. J63 TaxID=2805434 RepID=UPI002ABE63F7|nr:hypothetical protein [Paraburkholderia sp. J63]
MKAMWMKSALMTSTVTAAAHAQALINGTASPASVAQARGIQAQSQGSPANPGALSSTCAETDRTAAAPCVETNQQILGELVRIDTTLERQIHLQQLQPELEQHEYTAGH